MFHIEIDHISLAINHDFAVVATWIGMTLSAVLLWFRPRR